jgi:hypothetical protein
MDTMNNEQRATEIRHDKTTVESLQNIINAINANPTYTIKEEAYVLELHEFMAEARARENASTKEIRAQQAYCEVHRLPQ